MERKNKTPWPETILKHFKRYGDREQLVLMVPIMGKRFKKNPPLLVLPIGGSFHNFLPLAFLPDNEDEKENGDDDGNNNQNNPDNDAHGDNQGDGNNSENDGENNNNGDTNGGNSSTENDNSPVPENIEDSPDEEWPPVHSDNSENSPVEEWSPLFEESFDRELNEALDTALEEAYQEGNAQPTPTDRNRIRLRYGRRGPVFGVPDDWWKVDLDLTPNQPNPFDLHFGPPEWEDLEEEYKRPPYWPRDMEWPPRRYRLPGEWRPFDRGFKFGKWKIYITPIWPWN